MVPRTVLGGSATTGKTRAAYRYRRGTAMTVLVEPFASVYDDQSRLGVILVRGRGGFEAYAADNHSLGLFPSPRKAAAAITTTRPWVAQTTAKDRLERRALKKPRNPRCSTCGGAPRQGNQRGRYAPV
jgi:hypothetical protein